MKRWPELRVVKPQKLGMRRAKSTTKETVFKYFDELEKIMVKYDLKHKPHLIFNVDETGIQVEHSRS